MSFLSSLLGQDASHNAGVAQDEANQAQTEATGYRTQAAGLYNGLTSEGQQLEGQGTTQYNQYNNLVSSLLPQYEGAAGINGANNPGGTATPGGTAAPNNGFALTPDEQQQLNSQIDVINQQHQTAQQAYQGAAAQRGFVDPSATLAQNEIIAQHFNQAVNDHTAQFMNTAQQNRLTNLQNLMGFGASQAGAGTGQQEAGIGVQGGAAAGVAGLGGQAMENSAQQSANAANLNKESNSALGNFASLATYGLKQALGGGGKSTPATPVGSGNLQIPTVPSLSTGGNAWTGADPTGISPSYYMMGAGSGDAGDNANFNFMNGV